MFPHKWIKNKALNSLIIFLNSCVINKEKTLSVKLLFDVNIKDQFFYLKGQRINETSLMIYENIFLC